ncbi:hypothetical protein SLS58_006795 [Diplodia intermedia]|uniref:Uncharacterized protein n=1 Tax=Diplodia intermedia TaxID=856260 RepID=A0ABR3TM63_9PEZI
MTGPDNQQSGFTATSNDNATTFDKPAAATSLADSASVAVNDFDIVAATIKFLRARPHSPVNQSLTYDQCKAIFDEHKVFTEVCCALYNMGAVFNAKEFGYCTFSKHALADPRNRLPQYPDDA